MSTSSLAAFESPDRATVRLAKSFEPKGWLKAATINDDNSPSLAESSGYLKLEFDRAFTEPAARFPKIEGFASEQEFEGHVLDVNYDTSTFWARLIDVTTGMPDEEVEFDFKEIPSDDWSLIVRGALFSWNIGMETRHRQTRRVTEIRFRRFFQFSRSSILSAEQEASNLVQLIQELNYSE